MNLDDIKVNVLVDGVDEATEKVEKLVKTLKEAKTLADELASMKFDIKFKD